MLKYKSRQRYKYLVSGTRCYVSWRGIVINRIAFKSMRAINHYSKQNSLYLSIIKFEHFVWQKCYKYKKNVSSKNRKYSKQCFN